VAEYCSAVHISLEPDDLQICNPHPSHSLSAYASWDATDQKKCCLCRTIPTSSLADQRLHVVPASALFLALVAGNKAQQNRSLPDIEGRLSPRL
jgi:hypothetical protein